MGWSGIKDYGFGGKYRTREQDDEYRRRIAGVPKKRLWTKERCVRELEDILVHLRKILREEEKVEKGNKVKEKRERIRDLNTMMNRILEFMKYLYPPVQQNVNLNIDTTVDRVIERLKEAKKKELEEGGIVVKDE